MKMHEAYVIVYGFLCDYAAITKNLDVDSITSEMTPMTYIDAHGDTQYSSFDPAIYEEDWTATWNAIVGKSRQASIEQVNSVSGKLLEYYEQELDYDLDDASEFLRQRLGVSPLTGRKDWTIQLSA